METGLGGKVVLITGASGGIGQATARAFAAEGARLVLHGNRNMAALEGLQKELGAESLVLQADLTEEDRVEELFRRVYEQFGGLDVLVANAGVWPEEALPIHKLSLERWERTVLVDQTSVFLCAREFFRILEETRPEEAALIIVGSTAALFGEAGHADYAAAKAAITYGLTRSLKNELVKIVPRGRVNAVCPGWTRTQMSSEALQNREGLVRALQTRAIRRIARPEEIAQLIVFLASDKLAGQITGEIIMVAGGMEGRVLHSPEEIDPRRA
ncbi:MAG: SDR family NAD(P)-dependent oxidoreductase [Candidatus Bipolaricaulia bacterium]